MAVPMIIGADGSYSSSGPWVFIDADGNRVNVASNYYSVATYGAKCDGRVVSNGTISARSGAGNTTVTSATIAFTQADVGKRFAINATAFNAGYPIPAGYIVSVDSATSATVYVPATVVAIASGGSLCVVSDDSVAVVAAIAAATATGGNVFIPPGICGFGSAAGSFPVLPAGVNLVGAGNSRGDPFAFCSKGSTLVCVAESYTASAAFVTLSGSGSTIEGLNIDTARRFDYSVRIDATLCQVRYSTIARAVSIGLYVNSGSNLIVGNHLYNNCVGTTIQIGGDSMVKDNYIYGSGNGLPNLVASSPTDDTLISGNHFYKGWGSVVLSTVAGPLIQFWQFSTTDTAGGVISGNVFDTCYGDMIEVTVFNTSATAPMKALSISNNQFYQPLSIPTNTYSCIKITVGGGGANTVQLRGLSIMGNVGKNYAAGTVSFKSFIDWSITGPSDVYGDTIVGNCIDNCNLLYSGSAHTPGYTAGNCTIAGVGTTVAIG